MNNLEIIATITGIIGVALQSKEKIWSWPILIISVSVSAYIFFHSRLYSDFVLHLIYIILNFYGWYYWTRNTSCPITPTTIMTPYEISISTFITILGTFFLGFFMSHWTDADLPYFDAFTTSGSLVAQYLLAQKRLQNWWFWIGVDLVAIPVYLYKKLFIISFLFFVYLLLSCYGYFSWKKATKDIQD